MTLTFFICGTLISRKCIFLALGTAHQGSARPFISITYLCSSRKACGAQVLPATLDQVCGSSQQPSCHNSEPESSIYSVCKHNNSLGSVVQRRRHSEIRNKQKYILKGRVSSFAQASKYELQNWGGGYNVWTGDLIHQVLLVMTKALPPRRGWCSLGERLPLHFLEKLGWLPDFKNQQKEATPV